MPGPIILDNTVLSNLAIVGRADLVAMLWAGRACTTQDVMDEYRAAADVGVLPSACWDDLIVVEMMEDEAARASAMNRRLGAGERSCLAVALERGGLVLTDDADARAVAGRYGIPVSGTVGVLVLAVRRGHLTLAEGNELLLEMVVAGYRSPVGTLDSLL